MPGSIVINVNTPKTALQRFGSSLAPNGVWAAVLGTGTLSAAAYWPSDPLAPVLIVSGGTFLVLALASLAFAYMRTAAEAPAVVTVTDTVGHDETANFTTDVDGAVTYQNAAATERFGAISSKPLASALEDLFANPAAVLYRLQSRAAALGSAREDVVTPRTHMRISVVRLRNGNFLWRLEDLFERAPGARGAEGISLPMLTASKQGTVLFMNEALRKILGGRVKSLDKILTGGDAQHGTFATLEGVEGLVPVFLTKLVAPAGRNEYYFTPVSSESAPSLSNEKLPIAALPVPVLRIGGDGTVHDLNGHAQKLIGRQTEPGVFFSDLFEGLGRSVSDWLGDATQGRGLGKSEVLKVRDADQETFLQVNLSRLGGSDQEGLLAILNDATELKTLEAQFVQSQKMQAIGQLAGGVAHDFNNLLTAISGHCDLLLLKHDQGDPDYGDLVQIHQNANRAASLVGQLLAFSRKQNLQPEVMDLRDTLSDLTHLLNRLVGEKVSLSLVHDPELMPIRADKRQLEQVLMNLVVNARDAMPDGGMITIETEKAALTQPLERDRVAVPAGDYVLVKVTDEGAGISADKLPKIFEPFYTTKRTGEGTGLGLSTAYGIVKQTGGFIFADSEEGNGSCFSLYFPAHNLPKELQSRSQPRQVKKPVGQGEGVVLLVEDEAPVRAFASRALRMRGYTVIEAESAEEALETLEDKNLEVDVFVTDVIMPGLDGPTWVREALKTRPDARVVFVSGYAEDSMTDQQARIPNSVFLPKPFSLNELAATVMEQIH